MKFSVKVEGLKELDEALGDLPKATAKNVLRRTAKKALKPFDDRWRELAPELTGHLKRSGGIGTKLTNRQKQLEKNIEGKAFVTMFAGPGGDPAAIVQEFGSFDQSPQPFARPAWDETKADVLGIVIETLGEEIQKSADRLARKAAKLAAKG